jgi:short-subunit dehydrogenase
MPKDIVITGANGQSAVHIAQELLKYDIRLCLIAHNRTERIDKIVSDNEGKCFLMLSDLTDYPKLNSDLEGFFKAHRFSPDALIHTAAVRSYDAKTLCESDAGTWNYIVQSNISMAYNAIRCILPTMVEQQKGKIVLFGSNVTRTGLPYGSAYAAAKSALSNLVRSVALETAADNIQINMISPAPIETNLEEDYSGDYLAFRKEYFKAYQKSHPGKKLVSLNDITKMVLSLIDYELNCLSGEEIFVTGGVL